MNDIMISRAATSTFRGRQTIFTHTTTTGSDLESSQSGLTD